MDCQLTTVLKKKKKRKEEAQALSSPIRLTPVSSFYWVPVQTPSPLSRLLTWFFTGRSSAENLYFQEAEMQLPEP